jgi:hypothetical protein
LMRAGKVALDHDFELSRHVLKFQVSILPLQVSKPRASVDWLTG